MFYKTGGKLNLLQYKKLGVSGNQSQPAIQYGPLEFAGDRRSIFHGGIFARWHGHFAVALDAEPHSDADGKQTSEPEAEMAAGTTTGAPLRMRVFVGPKDLGLLEKTAAVAGRAG